MAAAANTDNTHVKAAVKTARPGFKGNKTQHHGATRLPGMASGAILRPSEAINEAEPIKYACAQQTHGKRAPNAYKAPAAVDAEEPA